MSFTGIYQFGSITTRSGMTINFDDIDVDTDGKMAQTTYNFIQKELGMDTVELTEEPQKGEKQVSDFEFVLWNQEAEIDNIFSSLTSQIATDFIGENAKYAKQVLKELRDFMNDFKAKYSSDPEKVGDMADDFSTAIYSKYEEIKNDLLK